MDWPMCAINLTLSPDVCLGDGVINFLIITYIKASDDINSCN